MDGLLGQGVQGHTGIVKPPQRRRLKVHAAIVPTVAVPTHAALLAQRHHNPKIGWSTRQALSATRPSKTAAERDPAGTSVPVSTGS